MTLSELELKIKQRQHSPLFARIADEYLKSGLILEAKQLCTSGLQLHPDYVTAHLILAKCYAAEYDYNNAIKSVQYVLNIYPDCHFVKSYLSTWRTRINIPTEISIEKHIDKTYQSITNETLSDMSQEKYELKEVITEKPTEEQTVVQETEQLDEIKSEIVENNEVPTSEGSKPLVDEVQPIKSKKEPVSQNVTPTATRSIDEGRIVSRTLAEIYAMQGAYKDAILTYQLLKRLHPARCEEIDRRISELEEKMRQNQTE